MQEIKLTQGKVTLIDDEDYDLVSQFHWLLHNGAYGRKYVRTDLRISGLRISVLLHRFLLDAPNGIPVDHVNGDGLDNQRRNIRLCTHSNNMQNMGKPNDCVSHFKGVMPNHKRWQAQISIAGNSVYLGNFLTEREAAIAYDEAATKHFGEFAKTNKMLGLL